MGAKGLGTEFLEELKSRNNLVQVIQKYIPLERKGRNYWGRCPFHHEKTPSFAVNEEGQYYKCFGCSASGDVIKFVQEMESVDFMDAVKLLCESCGMRMPEVTRDLGEIAEEKKRKDRLYQLMKECANYYYRQLHGKEGRDALEYLLNRGLSAETIKKFSLGYCPDFNGSIAYLKSRGFSPQEMKDAGVAGDKNGRLYDNLWGRLIYPIVNNFGDVIAFGGRVMEKKPEFAKYKNTAETSIFNKSRNLYGINLLKKFKQEQGIRNVIVVEGYMDTIALHQAGICNAVASMGTSLTKEQARILSKYTDEVLICYDGDAAGQKATIRGLDILAGEKLNVKVISLPDGLDPDEVIRERGREAYEACVQGALPLIDFKLYCLSREFDLNTIEGKRRYTSEALKVIGELDSVTEQEDCLKTLRKDTGFTLESLKRDLERLKENRGNEAYEILPPAPVSGDADADVKAARVLLYCLLTARKPLEDLDKIVPNLSLTAHFQVADYLAECLQKQAKPVPSLVFEYADEEGAAEVTNVLSASEQFSSEEELLRYYEDSLRMFHRRNLEQEIESTSAAFEASEKLDERRKYSAYLMQLNRELRELK